MTQNRLRTLLSIVTTGALGAFGASCGGEKVSGSVTVAISTDMRAPKDVDAVGLYIWQDGKPAFQHIEAVRDDGSVQFPSTFVVAATKTELPKLRVRLIAFQRKGANASGRTARVIRDAITTVPKTRGALLRVPLRWLNSLEPEKNPVLPDSAVCSRANDANCASRTSALAIGKSALLPRNTEGTPYDIQSALELDNGCPLGSGQTLNDQGECESAEIPTDRLPEFQEEEVFGGGRSQGGAVSGGTCFDVPTCFSTAKGGQSHDLTRAELEACWVPVTGGQVNVALRVDDAQGGHANEDGSFVPLDGTEWHEETREGPGIAIARGYCKRALEGKVRGIRIAIDVPQCGPKLVSQPVCSPAGSVRTSNTGEPVPEKDEPFGPRDAGADAPDEKPIGDRPDAGPVDGLDADTGPDGAKEEDAATGEPTDAEPRVDASKGDGGAADPSDASSDSTVMDGGTDATVVDGGWDASSGFDAGPPSDSGSDGSVLDGGVFVPDGGAPFFEHMHVFHTSDPVWSVRADRKTLVATLGKPEGTPTPFCRAIGFPREFGASFDFRNLAAPGGFDSQLAVGSVDAGPSATTLKDCPLASTDGVFEAAQVATTGATTFYDLRTSTGVAAQTSPFATATRYGGHTATGLVLGDGGDYDGLAFFDNGWLYRAQTPSGPPVSASFAKPAIAIDWVPRWRSNQDDSFDRGYVIVDGPGRALLWCPEVVNSVGFCTDGTAPDGRTVGHGVVGARMTFPLEPVALSTTGVGETERGKLGNEYFSVAAAVSTRGNPGDPLRGAPLPAPMRPVEIWVKPGLEQMDPAAPGSLLQAWSIPDTTLHASVPVAVTSGGVFWAVQRDIGGGSTEWVVRGSRFEDRGQVSYDLYRSPVRIFSMDIVHIHEERGDGLPAFSLNALVLGAGDGIHFLHFPSEPSSEGDAGGGVEGESFGPPSLLVATTGLEAIDGVVADQMNVVAMVRDKQQNSCRAVRYTRDNRSWFNWVVPSLFEPLAVRGSAVRCDVGAAEGELFALARHTTGTQALYNLLFPPNGLPDGGLVEPVYESAPDGGASNTAAGVAPLLNGKVAFPLGTGSAVVTVDPIQGTSVPDGRSGTFGSQAIRAGRLLNPDFGNFLPGYAIVTKAGSSQKVLWCPDDGTACADLISPLNDSSARVAIATPTPSPDSPLGVAIVVTRDDVTDPLKPKTKVDVYYPTEPGVTLPFVTGLELPKTSGPVVVATDGTDIFFGLGYQIWQAGVPGGRAFPPVALTIAPAGQLQGIFWLQRFDSVSPARQALLFVDQRGLEVIERTVIGGGPRAH